MPNRHFKTSPPKSISPLGFRILFIPIMSLAWLNWSSMSFKKARLFSVARTVAFLLLFRLDVLYANITYRRTDFQFSDPNQHTLRSCLIRYGSSYRRGHSSAGGNWWFDSGIYLVWLVLFVLIRL